MASVIRGSDNFDSAGSSSAESGGGGNAAGILTATPAGSVVVSGVPPEYTGITKDNTSFTSVSYTSMASERIGNVVFYVVPGWNAASAYHAIIRSFTINSVNSNGSLSITNSSDAWTIPNEITGHAYNYFERGTIIDITTDGTDLYILYKDGKVYKMDTNGAYVTGFDRDYFALITASSTSTLTPIMADYKNSIAFDGTNFLYKTLGVDDAGQYHVYVYKFTLAGDMIKDTANSNDHWYEIAHSNPTTSLGQYLWHHPSGKMQVYNGFVWETESHTSSGKLRMRNMDFTDGPIDPITFNEPTYDSSGYTINNYGAGIFFDTLGQLRAHSFDSSAKRIRRYLFSTTAGSVSITATDIGLLAVVGNTILVDGEQALVSAINSDDSIDVSTAINIVTHSNLSVTRVNGAGDVVKVVKLDPLTLAIRSA